MKIEVNREDIESGVRADCDLCPVALAIVRSAEVGCEVGSYFVTLFAGSGKKMVELPLPAMRFIQRFDACKPVSPFTFDLEIPEATK